MGLKGKIVVVTGASYGLGLSICESFLAKGAKVIGISRSEPKIVNPNFFWVMADLLNDSDVTELNRKVKFDHVDILVNNAGTAFFQKTLDFSDKSFNQMFDLNFKSPIKVVLSLISKLDQSLIINISSISDRYPDDSWGLYGASKAALNIFFETMATESEKLKVYNLLPSYIDTPLQHKLNDKTNFDWSQTMRASEVSESVMYLSENSSTIESGTRMIVLSNAQAADLINPEKLWYYNVATKKVNKLK